MTSEVWKVVRALAKMDDEKTLVWGELGSGFKKCKLPTGTKVGDAKTELYYLLSDIAHDLGIEIDREKLRKEIYGR